MKKQIVRLLLAFPVLLPLAVIADDDSRFYTGLWQYSIEVKMQAMPQSELKTVQKCIKELNEVIGLFKPDPSCSVSQVQADASRLSWALYCKTNGGSYHGDAKIEGNKHALHGRVDIQTTIPGMRNVMTTSYVINGINKGECR